jgi:methylamine--corrinoid protein Co-methyltransferase
MQHILDMIAGGTKMAESDHEELIHEVGLELVNSYEIVYDIENLIPNDDDMADRVFEAAIDLLELVGVYSLDTKKVLQIPRDSILRSIQNSRNYLNIGE